MLTFTYYNRPLFNFLHLLSFSFKWTIIRLFVNMLLIRSIVFLHHISLLSFKSNLSLRTVSWTEDKSIRITPVFMHFWYPASLEDVKVRTCSQHERPLWKPACYIGKTLSGSGYILLCIIRSNSLKLQLKSATDPEMGGGMLQS